MSIVIDVTGPASDASYHSETRIEHDASKETTYRAEYEATRAALKKAHDDVMVHLNAVSKVGNTAASGDAFLSLEAMADEGEEDLDEPEVPIGVDAPSNKTHRTEETNEDDG